MAAATATKKRYYSSAVNGSLAYDFDALERQLEQTGDMGRDLYTAPLEERSADVIARAHEHTKARVRTAQRLSPVIVVGYSALAVMLTLLVVCYVQLAAISNNVVAMNKEATQLETDQVILQTQYERAYDLASVKEAAMAAGMDRPSDSQIYYIDLSDPDNAVIYQDQEEGLLGWLKELGSSIFAMVEYFR